MTSMQKLLGGLLLIFISSSFGAGITLTPDTIPTNTPTGGFVATISPNNQSEVCTYSIIPTSSGGYVWFSVSNDSLYTTDRFTGRYVDGDIVEVPIRVNSNISGTYDVDYDMTVRAVPGENRRPRGITLSNTSLDMNQSAPAFVGELATVDLDVGDAHTYKAGKLGATSGFYNQFTIRNDSLFAMEDFFLDTDENDSPRVGITTTDQGGLSFSEYFTLSLFTSGNHVPTNITLSNNEIESNKPTGTVIASMTTTDPDVNDVHSYSVSSSSTSGSYVNFTISGDKLLTGPDFAAQDGDSVYCRVTTRDQGGRTFSKVFYIHVKAGDGANHKPTGITLTGRTVDESLGGDQYIGTFATEDLDEEDTHTYTATPYFTTSGMYNVFRVSNDTLYSTDKFFNYYSEGDSPRIFATTTDNHGLSHSDDFTLSVISTGNNAPTGINLSNQSVRANSPQGTFVAKISAEDPNPMDTHTYTSLNTSTTSGYYVYFTVSSDSLFVGSSLPFSEGQSAPCKLRATDNGGKSYTKSFSIAVTKDINDNQNPTDIHLAPIDSVDLNGGIQFIGALTTEDPDVANTHSYNVKASTQSEHNSNIVFLIRDDSLFTGSDFYRYYNYGDEVVATVTTEDQGGLTYTKNFTVPMRPRPNRPPTGITLSRDTVGSDAVKGDTVGLLNTIDPDIGDTHEYKVMTYTTGGFYTFNIKNNYLVTERDIYYEDGQSYKCKVRTTDQGGLYYDREFTIHVDAGETGNHKPKGITLSANSVVAKSPGGTVIGAIDTEDEDVEDTHTYKIYSTTSSSYVYFKIENDTLKTDGSFKLKFKDAQTFKLPVRATDNDGLFVVDTLDINITGAPSIIAVNDTTVIDEGATTTALKSGEVSLIVNDELLGQDVEVDVETMPKHGNLLISKDGTFTYTHDGSETAVDSFSYVVHSDVSHDFGTVYVVVNPVNDNIPVALDDIFNVQGGTLFKSEVSVLANDTDKDFGAQLTATLHTNAQHGFVELNADGTFEYDAIDEDVTDRFYYTVSDGKHSVKAMVVLAIEKSTAVELSDLDDAVEYVLVPSPSVVSRSTGLVTFHVDKKVVGDAELVVFNRLGRKLFQRFVRLDEGGSITWNLRDESGVLVAPESYLVLMEVIQGDGSSTYYKTMVGVKE